MLTSRESPPLILSLVLIAACGGGDGGGAATPDFESGPFTSDDGASPAQEVAMGPSQGGDDAGIPSATIDSSSGIDQGMLVETAVVTPTDADAGQGPLHDGPVVLHDGPGAVLEAAPPALPFGNATIHPEKVGFYMIPDLWSAYTGANWDRTSNSLRKLHELLPNAWIRWDNETGHNSDAPDQVEEFVKRTNAASVPIVIAASAVDGYNNYWAGCWKSGMNVPSDCGPNKSMLDVASGPYVKFAFDLAKKYPNVQFVETFNEPDGPWFSTDGDNAGDFDVYLGKVFDAAKQDGIDRSKILGPATAHHPGATDFLNIWNDYLGRPQTNISYHTYGHWNSLSEIPGKTVFVTEYGYDGDGHYNPATYLGDFWQIEKNKKISGSIAKLFVVQLTDAQGALNGDDMTPEGDHHPLRGWFRAFAAYQALGSITTNAYLDDAHPDFMSVDDGKGSFGALLWNDSGSMETGQARTIPNTSVVGSTALSVLRVVHGDRDTGTCKSLDQQSWVKVMVGKNTVTVTVDALEPLAAVLVTTGSCTQLAN